MLDALEAGDVDAYRAAVVEHYQPLITAIELAVAAHGEALPEDATA